jgi:hypothetical protein
LTTRRDEKMGEAEKTRREKKNVFLDTKKSGVRPK